jgi:hypothetical protein
MEGDSGWIAFLVLERNRWFTGNIFLQVDFFWSVYRKQTISELNFHFNAV